MPTRIPSRARRTRLLAGIALALFALAVGGYAAYRALTQETAEPASGAVARFRARPAHARMLPPALRDRAPRPGVYTYATVGSEVSHVLGTRRHPYPRATTMTVTATRRDCLRARWDVLAARSDAILACPRPDGSWRLATQSETHRFAGHLDRRTYVCTRDSTWLPAKLTTGARWSSRCATGGTTSVEHGAVRGPRTLVLHGRRSRTMLLRTQAHLSGKTVGTVTTLSWVLPSTHLVLLRTIRETSRTDTPVGDVRYEERATVALSSPRPRR